MALTMTKEDITLSVFTDKQQDAIIGWMFTERHFFISCIMHLDPNYFTSSLNGSIFQKCQEFFETHDRKPHYEEIKARFNLTNHGDHAKYHDKINLCIATRSEFGLDALSHDMTGWMRTVKLANSLHQAERLYNRKAFSEAVTWIEKKTAEIRNTSFEDDNKVVFDDATTFFAERKESFEDCLTIGHPVFDGLLREGAKIDNPDMSKGHPSNWTRGGLVKGDTTCILGPSNSGKTTTLTSIIIPNIMAGKYILYLTHEQKWEDIKTKLFMNACRATNEDLRNPTPDQQKAMRYWEKQLAEYLVYIPWIKAGDMWVESVLTEITLQQEMLKGTKNKYFDMIIDDYPGKLKSRDMKGRSNWEELDYVYDQFVNAGMQWRSHMILPVQTNRDGYKVNRGDHSEGRVIDQADAAGSFGIMQKADNVITLNRSPKEQAENFMRFFISKSRTQQAQTTFVTKTDFAKSITHGVNLMSLEISAAGENDASAAMSAVQLIIGQRNGTSVQAVIPATPVPAMPPPGKYPDAVPVETPEPESSGVVMPDMITNPAKVIKKDKKKK